MREEQRRQRDHDQVVEEEHPPGEEAGEVVERNPDERGCAAGRADRSRPLGIRERDDQKQEADDAEHRRREAERVQRDDPESEVDRRGDLPVRDGGERGRIEDPLQTRELAGHAGRLRHYRRRRR